MRARYVIDTNVLIAASAAVAPCPEAWDATPKEPEVRKQVWDWLVEFEQSVARLVLDFTGGIEGEYRRNLGFGDFGLQVLQSKWDHCAVDLTEVDYDEHGDGVLKAPLDAVIHDRQDRKMVAAALDAVDRYGETAIANAGDIDWYDWEAALAAAGLDVEQIIPEWSRATYEAKKRR